MDALDPFLANLNPALRYLAAYRKTAADFLDRPQHRACRHDERRANRAPAPRHYLKQLALH